MSNAMQVWVENNKEKIFALLPPHVSKERFVRNMVFQVANNPAVAGCDQRSVVESCLTATLHGLDIGVLGSCYLVPFKGRAQLIIGYQGLLDLARRAGSLSSVNVECVRENDVYRRTATEFEHEWNPFGERGEIIGFYAILKLKDGGEQVETMSKGQVDAIRSRSRSGGRGPWETDYEEMGKKTVLRRALKKIKLSIEDATMIDADDKASFEHAEVELSKPTAKAKILDALSAPDPAPQPEVDPDTGEVLPADFGVEAPELPGKPQGVSQPRPRSDRSKEDLLHLQRANAISEKLGLPRWMSINDGRRKLIMARMKAEGTSNLSEFWDQAQRVLGQLDESYYEGWSSGANLDTLLRVPTRGDTVDHYQRIKEGAGKKRVVKDVQVNLTREDTMDDELQALWDSADKNEN